jgi:prolyl oligopeptidase
MSPEVPMNTPTLPSQVRPSQSRRFRSRPSPLCALALLAACTQAEPTPRAPSAPTITATGVATPSLAPTKPHADTLHGVVVPDPYRWLEDTTSAEGRAWVSAQERYATSVLERVVGRDSLMARYAQAFAEAPTLDVVLATPSGLVLTRWLGDAPSLFAATLDGRNERPLRPAAANDRALRAIVPSPDGRLLALGTTAAGDSKAGITLINAANGTLLPDRIPDLLTSTSSTRYQVFWLPRESDAGNVGDAFVYPRLWPGSESGPTAGRLARGRQFLHRVGTPQSRDLAIFGWGVSPAVPMAPEDLATRVHGAPGSRWLVGSIFRSRQNGSDYYAARRTTGDSTVPQWTPLLALDDLAAHPQLHGDTAFALLRRDADRGRIARRVLGNGPTPQGTWETVVPERRGVIIAFAAQPDALYFTERGADGVTLQVQPYGATTAQRVTLPVTGTVRLVPQSAALDGVLVSVESWAMPPRWFRITQRGALVETLAIDDGGRATQSPTLVTEEIEAPSRDGTLVPVSLVYDRAALVSGTLDGTAPLLAEAYGAFAQSTDAEYRPHLAVWAALGGVYAYVHARGGGERGEAWHQAATRERKQRSVDDVIGAVEALIARGYTSPGRVAFQGISFGAVIGGLLPLQRPELFGAVLYDVGGPDEVRATFIDPSAARNVAEIGDVDTPEGVRSLMAASPYHVTPPRISLPAMLVHSARDDYNFGTEMLVGKWVARMQAANSGTRPLTWVRTEGGHRWLWSLSPEWAGTVTAFLLWQLGDPRYQPASR